MLGRRPARVRGHLALVHLDDGGRGRLGRTLSRSVANSRVALRKALLRSAYAPFENLERRTRAEAAPIFPIPYAPNQELVRVPVPLQNMPAARAAELADRRVLPASFCRAASGRASIYACKAFNTEARAGSNGEASERTTRDSRAERRGILGRGKVAVTMSACPETSHPRFAARNISL